jgi:hypothetical protein
VTQAATWPDPPPEKPRELPAWLTSVGSVLNGLAPALDAGTPPRKDVAAGAPTRAAPAVPNGGGMAETQPNQVLLSGLGVGKGN